MKKTGIILGMAIATVMVMIGCAHLQPGADPFVVTVERSETGARAGFDMILHVDQADRAFWRTNAPAFHEFCEWLRTPLTYVGTTDPLPRCVVMQLEVQDLKEAYKKARTESNSNLLYMALATLNTAGSQANSWSNIVTLATH
jgi:hypothetical protein